MLQIQNALGILSSQVPTGNLVWVDQINGVDALATRGRLTIPFKTLTAAKTAAKTGDTIMVLPGTYGDGNLLKDGVNWHFFPGANVLANETVFSTGGGGGVNCMVTGRGSFSTSAGNVVHVAAGNVQITGGRMAGSGVDVVVLSGGTSVIECDTIETSTGYPVNVSGGNHRLTAHRLSASTSEAICISGGEARLTAYEIFAQTSPAVRHEDTGASLSICHARIVSDSDVAIYFTSGGGTSSRLKLLGCLLAGVGNCIGAAGSVSVELLGGCCATLNPHANVAKIGDLKVAAFT